MIASLWAKLSSTIKGLHVSMSLHGGWGWDGAASLTTRGIESGARRAFNGNRPRPDGMRMMRFIVNNRFPPRNGRVRGPSVTVWMDLPKLFCLGPFLLSKVLGEPVRQMWGPLTAWTPLIGGARGTARLPRLVRQSSHHNPFLSRCTVPEWWQSFETQPSPATAALNVMVRDFVLRIEGKKAHHTQEAARYAKMSMLLSIA